MDSSAIIINHEVRKAGSFSTGVGKMLRYYSREEEFCEIGGCDRHVTDADMILEQYRALNTYSALVDYASRRGHYKNRNRELPLAAGERSGTCFGQHGLINPEKLKRELEESRSHLVTSVVSVRREDAMRLGLSTKEGFQKLLRKEWARQCEQWGVIAPQDIRWAAWFHTDNETSLHVHVVTWDRSGRFSDPAALIPRSQIWSSQSGIRREALKDSIAVLNRERTLLRDYASYRIKIDLGAKRDEDKERNLAERAEQCRCSLVELDGRPALDASKREGIISRIVSEAPEDATRSYSYARSSKPVREASLAAVFELRRLDPALDAALLRYEQIIRDVAQGMGLRSDIEKVGEVYQNPAEEYYRDAVFDLNRRCANSVLKSCSPVDFRRVHRDRDLVQMRREATADRATDSRKYAERYVEAAKKSSRRPLTAAEKRELENHAESIFRKAGERFIRDGEHPALRRERDAARTDIGRVVGMASALIEIFSNVPRDHSHDKTSGKYRGKQVHHEERSRTSHHHHR